MKIRKFEKGDGERCNEIIYQCIKISKKTTKLDKKYLERIYTPKRIMALSKKSDFFVVKNKGKVIGMGRLEGPRIATIYFDPEFHKGGGGTLIIKRLEGLAKNRKLKKVYLEALLQAIGFYEKCGFKKVKRLYQPMNSYLMEKIIR